MNNIKKFNYQKEYNDNIRSGKTGFDSQGYWWQSGHRKDEQDFYQKLKDTEKKYQNWKTKWKFRHIKHFTKSQRRQFALSAFLNLIKNQRNWKIKRLALPMNINNINSDTIAEGILTISNWKMKDRLLLSYVVFGDFKTAKKVKTLWDQARKPYGI